MRERGAFRALTAVAVGAMATTAVAWAHPDLWGTDRFFNEIRLVALDRCVSEGRLWVRWLPDLAHGHGLPLFHYYPPGLYGAAWPLHALGMPARSALLTVLTVALGGGAAATAHAAGRRAGRWAALLAGTLWLATPYLQVDLQVRHAWAELLGLCLLPVALSGFLDLAEGERRRGAWLRAVGGLAGVTLSHHVASLAAAGAIALLGVAVAPARGGRGAVGRVAGAFALGVGTTAFFWLPALLDRSLVRVDRMAEGFYAMSAHGVYPAQLVGVGFGRGPSVPGPDDAMSLSMGLAHALALGGLLVLAAFRPRRLGGREWVLAATAVTLAVGVMPFAAAHYEDVPLLRSIQAPFRLLGPLGLAAAWGVPLLLHRLVAARVARWVAAGVAVAALGLLVPAFTDVRVMTAEERAVYEPVERRGAAAIPELPEPWTSTTGFHEYLPEHVRAYPKEPTPGVADGPPWIRIETTRRECGRIRVEGRAERPGPLRLHAFDFPDVVVRVDGRRVPHRRDERLGFVEVPIPEAGPFTLEMRRGPTASILAGRAVSAVAAIAWLLAWLLGRRRSAPSP